MASINTDEDNEIFQAGYNILNAVVDYDVNHGVAAALEPEKFYVELLYDKRYPTNRLGRNVRVNYDLS